MRAREKELLKKKLELFSDADAVAPPEIVDLAIIPVGGRFKLAHKNATIWKVLKHEGTSTEVENTLNLKNKYRTMNNWNTKVILIKLK